MKKKLVLSILTLFILLSAFAQTENRKQIGYKKVSIATEFGYDFWVHSQDVMGAWKFNRSSSLFATYNIQINNSIVYVCPGLGFSFYNLYGNAMPEYVKNEAGNLVTNYVKIPDGVKYKKAKTTFNYFDIPIDLRIAIHEFQIGIGIKFSYLMSATAKYKGDKYRAEDISGTETGYKVKERYQVTKSTEDWKIAAQLRVGYNWIHLFASYTLTPLFKTKADTETVKPGKMYPVTVGIAIMPFKLKIKQ